MGSSSTIEWTNATWNPVRGCSRVSPGCGGAAGQGGCYAERQGARFCGPGQPYEGLVRIGTQGPRWTGKVRLVPERLTDPIRWRKSRRIFVNSMSDLFHEGLSDDDIDHVFAVMAICAMHDTRPSHVFQILTKRQERMHKYASAPLGDLRNRLGTIAGQMMEDGDGWHDSVGYHMPWPLPNVWLGVSVEDQKRADERMPELVETPAAVRFVSYEPALEHVDFTTWLATTKVSWLICGAESGPGARPFDIGWARSARDQCVKYGVSCFFKQDAVNGHKIPTPELDGKRWTQFPEVKA